MVESYFDPSLMDTCVVSLHCREAELRLVHMGVREEGKHGLGTRTQTSINGPGTTGKMRWTGDYGERWGGLGTMAER